LSQTPLTFCKKRGKNLNKKPWAFSPNLTSFFKKKEAKKFYAKLRFAEKNS